MLWEPAWQALWRVESIGDGSKKVAVLQPGLEWIPEDEIFWHQKKIVNKSLETEAGQERPKEWKIQGSGRRSGHQEVEEMLQDFHQFSSAAQSCPTLCDPMDCCTPGFLVLHSPLELTQIYVHWVGDAIQPSHLLFPETKFTGFAAVIYLFSHVQLFVTPWTAAQQASLSFTSSRSLLK